MSVSVLEAGILVCKW